MENTEKLNFSEILRLFEIGDYKIFSSTARGDAYELAKNLAVLAKHPGAPSGDIVYMKSIAQSICLMANILGQSDGRNGDNRLPLLEIVA